MSCNAGKEIKQRNLAPLDKKFSQLFINQSIKKETSKRKATILELLKIQDSIKIDTVKLEIQKDGQLKIEYEHPLEGKKSHYYKGKFKRRYYQVFLQRDQIVFPPIYWITHIERLRFSISKDNLLVINKYSEHTGMVLFMGGGYGDKVQFCFKKTIK